MTTRMANWLLSPFGRFTDASLMNWATRKTGLSDWGDEDFQKFLSAAVKAVSANGRLTLTGRLGARRILRWHLINRLNIEALLREHPEIRDISIERPIFIVGWWRTGTTFLHNLLALDPANRVPKTWELWFPTPELEDRERDIALRQQKTFKLLKLSRWLVPEQSTAHHIEVDGPEECLHFLENQFVSTTLMIAFCAHEYGHWLLEQDMSKTYEYLKLQYQILQWHTPGRRWIFKCPFHLLHLETLLDTFPNAELIFTHRDVLKAVPSACSMSTITTAKFIRNPDLHALGDFWVDMYRQGIDRAKDTRNKLDPAHMLDIDMHELTSDPKKIVEKIYERFRIPFPAEMPGWIDGYLAANPRSKHGVHKYTLEEFGLDPDAVREQIGAELGSHSP